MDAPDKNSRAHLDDGLQFCCLFLTSPKYDLDELLSPLTSTLPTTVPCRPSPLLPRLWQRLHLVAPPNVDHPILLVAAPPNNYMACPGALVGVTSPGQARLQIFDLSLIPIVGFRPTIDYIRNMQTHAIKKL